MNVVEPSEAVLAAAAGGRKIEAIKLLRQEQGLSLKDAKEAVERLSDDRSRAAMPSEHRAGREDRGVARMVVILCVLAGLVAGLYLF